MKRGKNYFFIRFRSLLSIILLSYFILHFRKKKRNSIRFFDTRQPLINKSYYYSFETWFIDRVVNFFLRTRRSFSLLSIYTRANIRRGDPAAPRVESVFDPLTVSNSIEQRVSDVRGTVRADHPFEHRNNPSR